MAKFISNEIKEAILKKALTKGEKSLTNIALENGVSVSTLSRWLKESSQQGNAIILGRAAQFRHLQAIAKLNEAEVGAYCRQNGLYSAQLKEWEENFMNTEPAEQKYKAEINLLRKKNLELEKELRRKDKALAEAAALLVLKKKLNAIWGDQEDA